MIKDHDDLRVPNREAFKMEQVYKFNLGSYIHYYDYDLCDEKSDEEYSDNEEERNRFCFSEHLVRQSDDRTAESENPFGSGSSASFPQEKSNSIGVSSHGTTKGNNRLPKQVKSCLDGFTEKMAKTKSFH